MNTATIQSPSTEPRAAVVLPKPQYVGDCIVIHRAEFARLIRQHRSLRIVLFVQENKDVASCQTACCGFRVPAKVALEQLARLDFDAFEWRSDEFGPSLWHYAAPLHLQLQRRRELLLARIPRTEARLARPIRTDEEEWSRKIRRSDEHQLASDRVEVARLDAQIATARTEAAAA